MEIPRKTMSAYRPGIARLEGRIHGTSLASAVLLLKFQPLRSILDSETVLQGNTTE
jgi:hypothetical protein